VNDSAVEIVAVGLVEIALVVGDVTTVGATVTDDVGCTDADDPHATQSSIASTVVTRTRRRGTVNLRDGSR
jgi:hypothetical protein